mgnify:FL=1
MNDPKTPRDWLLHRHEPATPQLSALRRDALPPAAFTWRDFLRELFQPQQTLWKALAAIWLGLVVFHLTAARPNKTDRSLTPSPEALAIWWTQVRSNETLARIVIRP